MNVAATESVSSSKVVQLADYPRMMFGTSSHKRWDGLCDELLVYKAPPKSLSVSPERKWELVSALQKSIRRGDRESALKVISAMDGMPREYSYFWKRLCVIACEDVGLADDELAKFVVACSTIFTPMKTGAGNYGLFCFLAERMCALPRRSRIYCSLAVIDDVATVFGLPALSARDRLILAAITQQKTEIREGKRPWREWQRKNGWRAEGLVQYLGIALMLKASLVTAPLPISKTICLLPDYCYDMHTRVGLAMLKSIAAGVEGAEAIHYFLSRYRVRPAHIALGWALFFIEGGRIAGELVYEELSDLEQRVIAHRFALPVTAWQELRALLSVVVDNGVIERERRRVLHEFYKRPMPQSGNLFDTEMTSVEAEEGDSV